VRVSWQAVAARASPAVDCVIVGTGLAGLSAAITLFDMGARVVMLEKEAFMGGNSGKVCSCAAVRCRSASC
jgi:heterodisulfide reductase subunit A-like polyferredoxin